MDKDKIEIISEQLHALKVLWNLLRAASLDNIDKELNFYRLEKDELLFDRWHLDHDLGYPVYEKPEEVRPRRKSGESVMD